MGPCLSGLLGVLVLCPLSLPLASPPSLSLYQSTVDQPCSLPPAPQPYAPTLPLSRSLPRSKRLARHPPGHLVLTLARLGHEQRTAAQAANRRNVSVSLRSPLSLGLWENKGRMGWRCTERDLVDRPAAFLQLSSGLARLAKSGPHQIGTFCTGRNDARGLRVERREGGGGPDGDGVPGPVVRFLSDGSAGGVIELSVLLGPSRPPIQTRAIPPTVANSELTLFDARADHPRDPQGDHPRAPGPPQADQVGARSQDARKRHRRAGAPDLPTTSLRT